MRVAITGGTGNVGRAVVEVLATHGHEITVLGLDTDVSVPGGRYTQCDISDFDTLLDAIRGHEAIVHLAAYPSPIARPGREIFRVNALGTFNVFEAAAEARIHRVVGTSSINALGYFYGDRGVPIRYVPLDEKHPALATDAYSFSKQSMESIGTYFWERDAISSVMLRLPGVIPHVDIQKNCERYSNYELAIVERLLEMNATQRTRELQRLQSAYDEYRRRYRADKHIGGQWRRTPDEGSGLAAEELHFMHQKVNFFSYIDEFDSAQAVLRGLSAQYEGSHPLFINARRNSLGLSVAEIAKLYAPDSPVVHESHEGDDTIVSIDRARSLIGFEPQWAIEGKIAGFR